MKKIDPAMSAAAVAGLFAFLFVSVLGVSQTAFAVRGPEPPLHPKTYHSPSGQSRCLLIRERKDVSASHTEERGSPRGERFEVPLSCNLQRSGIRSAAENTLGNTQRGDAQTG